MVLRRESVSYMITNTAFESIQNNIFPFLSWLASGMLHYLYTRNPYLAITLGCQCCKLIVKNMHMQQHCTWYGSQTSLRLQKWFAEKWTMHFTINTLRAGLIQVVRKKQLIWTWLCGWISPLLFALATRRKSQKTWPV